MSLQPTGPRHWQITRDIKPKGACPACDLAWKVMEEDAERRRPKAGDPPQAGVDSGYGR